MSKKQSHTNAKNDRACSEFQETAELSMGDSMKFDVSQVLLATNTFHFPGEVNVCYKADYTQCKCQDYRSDPNVMKPLITAIPAQDFPHDIFATFAISAVLLTDYLLLQISKMDIKLKNIQEH